jgi:hypothetical protein
MRLQIRNSKTARERNIKSLRKALGVKRPDYPMPKFKDLYVPPTSSSILCLREFLLMTQVMIARQLNVHVHVYKCWERGRKRPNPFFGGKLRELAQMNGIDLDLLSDVTYREEIRVRVFGVEQTA